MFVFSQWFLSYKGNFTAVYHSVRGRALTSFTGAFAGIGDTFAMSSFLEPSRLFKSAKFRWAFAGIYTLYTIVWVCSDDHAFQTFMCALVGSLTENVYELERYTGFLKAVNTGGAALGYTLHIK
ncbi:hypothetical protein BDW69DRAFT_189477 [Aspergillus filifer]